MLYYIYNTIVPVFFFCRCSNVNWARRPTCNMCNAPKFVEVEERTGLGGGYNDRGIVEYKQRDDSDNEYDEVIVI